MPLKDLSSNKSSFQQMFMKSNNKFVELLKSKQNFVQQKEPPKTPISSKRQHSPSGSSTGEKIKKVNNTNLEFSPGASSTQIRETTFDLGKQPESSKKKKVKRMETVTDSSDSDSAIKKRRKLKAKASASESSDSEVSEKIKMKEKYKHEKIRDEANDVPDRFEEAAKKVIARTSFKSQKGNQSEDSDLEIEKPKKKKSKKHNEDLSDLHNRKHKEALSKTHQKDSTDDESSDSDESVAVKRKSKSPRKSYVSNDSDSDTETVSTKSLAQLRKFEGSTETLSRVEKQFDALKSSLHKNIFLVQIPKSLDPQKLVGTTISLSNSTRVPAKSRKYDCIPSSETSGPVAISLNTDNIHVVKPIKNIKVQRHLKSKRVPDFEATWNSEVSFPNDLKQRHPLFGADYKEKINLEEHIQQKLQAAIDSLVKHKKKKKKHKVKEEKTSEVEEEEIFKFLSQTDKHETGAKKSKKQSEWIDTNSDLSDTKTEKKKKKEKHAAQLLMEISSELNQPKKKHKKVKQEVDDVDHGSSRDNDAQAEIDSDGHKKKKKKHRKHRDEDDTFDLIDQMLLSKTLESSSTKKKKRDSSQ